MLIGCVVNAQQTNKRIYVFTILVRIFLNYAIELKIVSYVVYGIKVDSINVIYVVIVRIR